MRTLYAYYLDTGIPHMNQVFDIQAPKKATNIRINSDLLAAAKKLKINLSATLETSLIELVITKQREL